MSLETMTKLATTTVGVGGSASVSFTNIPQGYTDLVLKTSTRQSGASSATTIRMGFNGDTGANYAYRFVQGAGSSTASSSLGNSATNTSNETIVNGGAGATVSVFASGEIYINNYTSFNFKSWSSDSVQENNATTAYARISRGIWNNSSPITSISLVDSEGSFVQHSTFTLYGIKNARQTAGNSIKATGGNIVFDGTYVYHVFPSTGAFVPTQSILADALVVAGGGSGGYSATTNEYGGGGGAGGYRSSTNQTLTAGITYAVTVGAGGASTTSSSSSGSDSAFNLITSTGGGFGGTNSSPSGGVGGSGGGGRTNAGGTSALNGYYSLGNTPSTSPSQGNNGGQGWGNFFGSGGGGGAGAVGVNGSASAAGAGGAGSNAHSSWLSVTGGGVNGYLAGGGGGSGAQGATAGAGGSGGGGAGKNSTSAGDDAIVNTGSGGGSAASSSGAAKGGNGGSGIIIIRYKG